MNEWIYITFIPFHWGISNQMQIHKLELQYHQLQHSIIYINQTKLLFPILLMHNIISVVLPFSFLLIKLGKVKYNYFLYPMQLLHSPIQMM